MSTPRQRLWLLAVGVELPGSSCKLPLSLSAPRGEGGGVTFKNLPIMRTNSTGNADEGGGGGNQNPKNPADVLNGSLPINIAIIEGISGLVFIYLLLVCPKTDHETTLFYPMI